MSTKRTVKWQRRMLNYISLAGERGLTLQELRETGKMANLQASDRWLRSKLELLEARSLVWWNPKDSRYRSRADPRGARSSPRPTEGGSGR